MAWATAMIAAGSLAAPGWISEAMRENGPFAAGLVVVTMCLISACRWGVVPAVGQIIKLVSEIRGAISDLQALHTAQESLNNTVSSGLGELRVCIERLASVIERATSAIGRLEGTHEQVVDALTERR